MSEARQFLYKLHATRAEMLRDGPTDAERATLEEHYSYLRDLTDRGVVLLAGRTQNPDESAFGIVLLLADTERAARDIMNEDPAVKHGVMRAELYPYRAALVGKGWNRVV